MITSTASATSHVPGTGPPELGASRAQAIYATVFLLSRLHDSVFSGEEAQAKEAYVLAERMGFSEVIRASEW